MIKKRVSKYEGYVEADKHKIGSIPDFKENTRFTEIYNELKDLCKFIEKQKSVQLTQSLKNYILIRLINVAESQLQTITTDLIDSFGLEPADVLEKKELTISLHELSTFRQPDTTNGKIVTQAFQFTNIRSLSEIFSSINGLKFFPWLEDLLKHNIEKEFEEILLMRYDVVHNLHDVEWSPTELEKTIGQIQSYMNMFYQLSWINLDTDPKHKQKLEYYTKKLDLESLDEFRKISKKYQS